MWLNGEVLFIVFGWPVLMLCVCVCVYVSSAWNGWLTSQPASERAFNIALKSLQTHERAWNPFIYGHLASDWVNTRELGRGKERENDSLMVGMECAKAKGKHRSKSIYRSISMLKENSNLSRFIFIEWMNYEAGRFSFSPFHSYSTKRTSAPGSPTRKMRFNIS